MSGLEGSTTGTLTGLLREARAGSRPAMDRLFERVYPELRRMARAALDGQAKSSLDGTGLVNAACERLIAGERLDAEDRRHFFFLLGRAMHDELVEQARSDLAAKRGGGHVRVPLGDYPGKMGDPGADREVGEALEDLKGHDPQAAQVVMLRFFGGKTLHEAAELMGCTFSVARRHWEYARAWLHERLARGASQVPPGE